MPNQIFLFRLFPRLIFWINRCTGANYEDDMELLGVLCDHSKVSIDVGAKIGMYLYRLRAHSKKVLAFEPIPELNSLLTKVFGNKTDVEIKQEALSDKAGSATIRFPIYRFGYPKYGQATIEQANGLTFPNVRKIREHEVALKRLDDYADEDIGFIKIDVEGHELSVLKGAKKILKNHQPSLVIEAQNLLYDNIVDEVYKYLKGFGYQGFFLSDHKVRTIDKFDKKTYPDVKNFIYVHGSKDLCWSEAE